MRSAGILVGLTAVSITIAGCGGTFAGTVALGHNGGNGNGGGVPTSYSAPVQIAGGAGISIAAVAPNGQMAGVSASQAPLYWASPTATPASVNLGTYLGVRVYGINNAGQMVGVGSSGAQTAALYWSSPTATPVALNETGLGTSVAANGINASGAIIGTANGGTNNSEAVAWSSPTAAPAILPGPTGGSNQGQAGDAIADTGEMYGGAVGQPLAWAPGTTAATPMNVPAGGLLMSGYAVNHQTGEVGSTLQTASLQTVGFYWTLPNFTFTQVAVPAGFTKTTFLLGIEKSGMGVGYYSNGSMALAAIWPTLSTAFVDVNTMIPAGTNWTLQTAAFVTDSGVLVGLGFNPSNQNVWYTVQPN